MAERDHGGADPSGGARSPEPAPQERPEPAVVPAPRRSQRELVEASLLRRPVVGSYSRG